MKKLVIGVTGASGIIYAVRLLEALHRQTDVETHVIFSKWAKVNLANELNMTFSQLEPLYEASYEVDNLGAPVASGSFPIDGMIVVPCSMKTLSAIANGYDDNLIARAASVALKEQRKLILCPRETPLNAIQLENMLKLARIGVQIVPPIPAFYNHPHTIGDLVDHQIMKLLDAFHLDYPGAKRWQG
ncbi:MAG: UbiX family flavin prenyltransferase [Sporolactobacillus sp.]